MFERYTEKARRVVFFGRYEASQVGSPHIETEHLLLGLLREDKALTKRFLCSAASVESIRKQIEEHTTLPEKTSTRIDIPLSNECKRVLAYAAEEAERLSHKHIGTEHLLLGLLREDKFFAARILHECGLRLSNIREELAPSTHEQAQPQWQWASMARRHHLMAEDLTLAADASPWAREAWWSGRRLRYNFGLLVAGLLGFICYVATVERCIALHAPGDWEITIFTTIFQAFAYLVMLGVANVCYLLGPWSERVLRPHNVATYRTAAFRVGFWFSVMLPLAPSAVLFVSCSIHRAEDKRIILELIRRVIFG